MLKTIKGYKDTQEAAKYTAAIEDRAAGAALFQPEVPVTKFQQAQAPKL
jgi:hypothetical protein